MDHLLKSSKYKDHLYEVDAVYFYIDPAWKKILINLSGGADSAIMSYILCDYIVANNLDIEIHVNTGIRNWETRPWFDFNSRKVFEYLENCFPQLTFIRRTFFIPPELEFGRIGPSIKDVNGNMKSGDQIISRAFGDYVCQSEHIDGWFSGLTKNIDHPAAELGMATRNADFANTEADIQQLMFQRKDTLVCNPMRFVTKDWVMKQYVKYNQQALLALTRSCEGEFASLDYSNYIPGQLVPECGECYWCVERNLTKESNGLK